MDKAPKVDGIDIIYLDNTKVAFICNHMDVNCNVFDIDTDKMWILDGTTKIEFTIEPHKTIHVALKVRYNC